MSRRRSSGGPRRRRPGAAADPHPGAPARGGTGSTAPAARARRPARQAGAQVPAAAPPRRAPRAPAGGEGFAAWAAGIFLAALALRLLHLWPLRAAPFFALRMGDAESYHAWAQRIAGGDWIGSEVFYQAPLYPYWLGAVYALLGDDPFTVRLCQAVLGALACTALAAAGWRFFSKPAGIAAGLMLAAYAPALFFDGIIQKSVLDALLIAVILALLSRLIAAPAPRFPAPARGPGARPPSESGQSAAPAPGPAPGQGSARAWLGVGAALGALMLTRENAAVFAGAVLLWILAAGQRTWARTGGAGRAGGLGGRIGRDRAAAAGALLAGLALVLTPVAARNLAVGGELHLTTAQFGPNFYIGNHAGASGVYAPLRPGRGDPRYERTDAAALAEQAAGAALTPGEVSRYWTRRTLDDIRRDPGGWLQLLGRKLRLAWNAAEVADTEDQLSHADWSPVLRAAGAVWHFGVLAPLAAVGVLVTWPRRRELALLHLMAAAYAATLVVFAVMARYRYPLAPFLILFAAAGVTGLRARLGALPRTQAAAAGAAIVAFAAFCNWPIQSMAAMRAVTDSNVGTELQAQGDLDAAIARYRAALARTPDDPLVRANLGAALAAGGRLDAAIAQYERALALAPDDADTLYNLANALAGQDRLDEAVVRFEAALRLDPGHAEAHVNLGNALAALGRPAAAADHYRRGAALDPDAVEPITNLGLLLAAQGDRAGAMARWRQAIAIAPDVAEAHGHLGNALREAGDLDGALVHLRRAAAIDPASASARNALGVALGAAEAFDEAAAQFRRALAIDPAFTEASANLALVFQLRGDPAGAIAQYQALLRVDPAAGTAHAELGRLLVRTDRLDEAVRHWREAVRLDPANAEWAEQLEAARAARAAREGSRSPR